MAEEAKKSGKQFGVAHVFRFCESVTRMRERLSEIGSPTIARAEFSFFAPPDHARTWLHDRSIAGGGPIADIGVHCIDTLRYVLQDEVVRVTALGRRDARAGDVESSAALALEFGNGTLATVAVSYRAEYYSAVEIHGDRGAIACPSGMAVDFPVTLQLIRENKVVGHETFSNDLAYALQVDEFAHAVEGKARFRAPGEEGWKNQLILDAAYRSIGSGKAERVESIATVHAG